MPKKLTKEDRIAILKNTSEQIKAGNGKAIIAVSVLEKPYSAFNQMFLANQEATPGVFGGFHQWLKAGRKVKKVEHGYSICFPVMRHQKEEQMTELMKDEKPNFAMVAVFHIDQTEPVEADKDPELTHALAAGAITD